MALKLNYIQTWQTLYYRTFIMILITFTAGHGINAMDIAYVAMHDT